MTGASVVRNRVVRLMILTPVGCPVSVALVYFASKETALSMFASSIKMILQKGLHSDAAKSESRDNR